MWATAEPKSGPLAGITIAVDGDDTLGEYSQALKPVRAAQIKAAREQAGLSMAPTHLPDLPEHTTGNFAEWGIDSSDALLGLHRAAVTNPWRVMVNMPGNLIDDSATHITAAHNDGRIAITYDRPWNRHLDGPRITHWDTAADTILNVLDTTPATI